MKDSDHPAMLDHELKKLLLDTCAVRPGQEPRAWSSLKLRLASPGARRFGFQLTPLRSFFAGAVTCLVVIAGMNFFIAGAHKSIATADSQAPGIFATSFYSDSAQAQVVWLNGLDPATDKPTYLDPTRPLPAPSQATPSGDPNSL
jgi:hypothetical protein